MMKKLIVAILLVAGTCHAAPRNRLETYSAQVNGLTLPLLAADVFELVGSSTKTVYVTKVALSGWQTTGSVNIVNLFKNATVDSGGTPTIQPATAYDSTNRPAGATAISYSANPTSGTRAGRILQRRMLFPSVTGANSDVSEHVIFQASMMGQAIVLRGASESLSINMGGITLTGGVLSIYVEWFEDDP